MRFFVDTADVDQIRKANDMGVICGVTIPWSFRSCSIPTASFACAI